MQQNLEERIRLRAYEIWSANGHGGNADHHWLTAERQVLAGLATTVVETKSNNARKKRARSTATAAPPKKRANAR